MVEINKAGYISNQALPQNKNQNANSTGQEKEYIASKEDSFIQNIKSNPEQSTLTSLQVSDVAFRLGRGLENLVILGERHGNKIPFRSGFLNNEGFPKAIKILEKIQEQQGNKEGFKYDDLSNDERLSLASLGILKNGLHSSEGTNPLLSKKNIETTIKFLKELEKGIGKEGSIFERIKYGSNDSGSNKKLAESSISYKDLLAFAYPEPYASKKEQDKVNVGGKLITRYDYMKETMEILTGNKSGLAAVQGEPPPKPKPSATPQAQAEPLPKPKPSATPQAQAEPLPKPKPPTIPLPDQSSNIHEIYSRQSILSLRDSGENQYPDKHSVFTTTLQDGKSKSFLIKGENGKEADITKYEKYLENLKGNYSKVHKDYTHTLAQEIKNGGGKISIETALIKVTKELELGKSKNNEDPLYRLSGKSTKDDPNKDFEVIMITGSPSSEINKDENGNRFKYEGLLLKESITNAYKDKCKEFETLNNPNLKQLENAVAAKADSCRANGRKLYILYSGHGGVTKIINVDERGKQIGETEPEYQKGINSKNKSKEGSMLYNFGLDNVSKGKGLSEDKYKEILNKYLKDIETISIINSCQSGAAVTAIDNDLEKKFGTVST